MNKSRKNPLAALALLVAFPLAVFAATPATRLAVNPIIPGFNPDPSICRVGDDFYLATSTFEYFPGVPIYHSRDLVNWRMIGHALHTPALLNLDQVESTAGIFAPTLRYHNGTYYMITTLVAPKPHEGRPSGNFIVTAQDPAGPWSGPHWIADAPGIDPSLFFDNDGRAYYCGNRKPEKQVRPAYMEIWIREIDLKTFQLKGPTGILDSAEYFATNSIGNAVAFEAPHIYKKDGFYYLLLAHGGTGETHAVSIWKSATPLGPWTGNPANPILTHRDDKTSGINATGHADIFQDPKGHWWAVFLGIRGLEGKRSPMGRETFLAPVDWSGEWPVVNPHRKPGRAEFTFPAPDLPLSPADVRDFRDDFAAAQLNLRWTMIRTPRHQWWDLAAKPGALRLTLRPDEFVQYAQPSFLGLRLTERKIEVTTRLDFTPKSAGDCAGLALERGHAVCWTLVQEQADGAAVASVYFGKERLGRVPLASSGPVELRIRLDGYQLTFFAKQDGGEWRQLAETAGPDLGFSATGRFTGTLAGLYASSRGGTEGTTADFEWFEMQALTP